MSVLESSMNVYNSALVSACAKSDLVKSKAKEIHDKATSLNRGLNESEQRNVDMLVDIGFCFDNLVNGSRGYVNAQQTTMVVEMKKSNDTLLSAIDKLIKVYEPSHNSVHEKGEFKGLRKTPNSKIG